MTLTPIQLQALQSYAASHGRTWKSQLNHAWMTGQYDAGDDSSALQQLCNSFGPSWLVKLKLPTNDEPTPEQKFKWVQEIQENDTNRMEESTVVTATPYMDQFTLAYITASLWSSTGDSGDPLDATFTPSDIAPECLANIIADCKTFQSTNESLLMQAGDAAQNGHDYWLTRNRHGAGFWDRGYPKDIGQALTDAAHKAGERVLYVGDDGQLYVYPPDMTTKTENRMKLTGNKYTAREDSLGNITITRKADGATCLLQGDDAIEFIDNHRILGAIDYPSGPFSTSRDHVDACLDMYDGALSA